MPKVNVYLPDELAEQVKESGIPVSAVCQHSLEQAVRRVAEVRAAVAGRQDLDEALARLTSLTGRTRTALTHAVTQARTGNAPAVDTAHLLDGILAEGTNLALHVLRAVDVEPDRLGRDLRAAAQAEQAPVDAAVLTFSPPAAEALRLAVTEAISFGHNYVGCEHLLLGLAAEPDGTAGTVLRGAGADSRTVRRAVGAAVAGYAHLRSQQAAGPAPALEALVAETVRRQLAPVVERLTALEERRDRTDRS
jgi:ATP-dependent Clp protease ATP-binding subunit ClpC